MRKSAASRKRAKNFTIRRKNDENLTVCRKHHYPSETLGTSKTLRRPLLFSPSCKHALYLCARFKVSHYFLLTGYKAGAHHPEPPSPIQTL